MKTLYKLLYPALAFAAMAFVLITACQKLDFGTVTKSNIQNVTVRDASTVKVEMQIFDLSDDAHPDYGVCYSETNQLPTVADSKVAKGAPGTIKTDSIILQGLQPGSKIYIRAFVMNGSNPQYSFNVKDATLPQLPATTTLAATNISQTAATLNGTVNASNNTTTVIFEYGTTTTYGQTINATPDTVTGTTNTNVSASLTALQPNTNYHYRVKASCEFFISFGLDLTFTTSEIALPEVTTSEVTNITQITATSGGNVISDGGATVSGRGICWSTSSNPTIADNHIANGIGNGSFSGNLTNLSQNTLYYVRSYASNIVGMAYGNQLIFKTLAFPCGNNLTDPRDNKVYATVQIGAQCWMKQNLNIGNLINGTIEQTNNGSIEKYCYNNLETNCDIYGGLFQWNEMMQYTTNQGSQGICPSGWHLPTDAEFTILITYLGGNSVAGGKLKETGNSHWSPPNTNATNSSGFTALPGGFKVGEFFMDGCRFGYFWSSTGDGQGGNTITIHYNSADVDPSGLMNYCGCSVRCLRDD